MFAKWPCKGTCREIFSILYLMEHITHPLVSDSINHMLTRNRLGHRVQEMNLVVYVLMWVASQVHVRECCVWTSRQANLERARWGLGFKHHWGLLQTTCGKTLGSNVAWSVYVLCTDCCTALSIRVRMARATVVSYKPVCQPQTNTYHS